VEQCCPSGFDGDGYSAIGANHTGADPTWTPKGAITILYFTINSQSLATGMKSRTLLLFSCLVVVTVALGAVTLGFTSSLFSLLSSGQIAASKVNEPTGNLLVRVFFGTNYTGGNPISNASVALRDLALPSSFQLSYHTNSTGELELVENAGRYTVLVSDTEFQTSVTLSIGAGNTTEMDVGVNQTSRIPAFTELKESGLSDFAAPWQLVVIAIPATSTIYHTGQTVFVQESQYAIFSVLGGLSNGSLVTFNQPGGPQVQATVLSSDLRVSNQSSFLWLTLELSDFLPVNVFQELQIVTYSASSQVSIHAS
jgi:hypothetical protein